MSACCLIYLEGTTTPSAPSRAGESRTSSSLPLASFKGSPAVSPEVLSTVSIFAMARITAKLAVHGEAIFTSASSGRAEKVTSRAAQVCTALGRRRRGQVLTEGCERVLNRSASGER